MGFEDTLREQFAQLPVPDVSSEALRSMRDRVAADTTGHRWYRRSRVWTGVAAAVFVVAGAAYAWQSGVRQQQPVQSHAAGPKPSDVQVSFWPIAPGTSIQSEGPPPQRFEVSVTKWPKGHAQQVIIVIASTNPKDQSFISDVEQINNSSAGSDGGPLSWQNAINHWLQQNNLSSLVTQMADPNATNGNGQPNGKFIVDIGGTARPFNPEAYRLVIMDVEDMGGQVYEVKWAQKVRPEIPRTFTQAVTLNLPEDFNHVQALWQGSFVSNHFGLFKYQKNGQTYLFTASGKREEGSYWSIGGDLMDGQEYVEAQSGDFQTFNWSGINTHNLPFALFAGTATMPGAARVKVTWSDGKVDTVPIQNGGFGDLRTSVSAQKVNNLSESSVVVLSRTNQILYTETTHALPNQ